MDVAGCWRWARAAQCLRVLLVAAVVAACSRGTYHRVRPGETLYRISKAYGVSVDELTHVNRLTDPSRIEVGQDLLIPGARRQLPVDLITPKSVSIHPPRRDEAPKGAPLFAWPIEGGTVTSSFGERGNSFHDGIDISAPVGTPVRAAQAGEVIYSDVLRGYGNVIIVRHRDGFATVYAHNARNLVQAGQQVQRGAVIASVGDSGRTNGANLHFEVRKDNVARNPLYFLPAT